MTCAYELNIIFCHSSLTTAQKWLINQFKALWNMKNSCDTDQMTSQING